MLLLLGNHLGGKQVAADLPNVLGPLKNRKQFFMSPMSSVTIDSLTVTLYLMQSFQKLDAENFFLMTVVAPPKRAAEVPTWRRRDPVSC